MAEHDIMKGSRAWETVQNGIPREISPDELRIYLHAWVQILASVVNSINDLYDGQEEAKYEIDSAFMRAAAVVDASKVEADKEHVRLHNRIDRRGEDTNALGKTMTTNMETLKERLFDSEKGVLPTFAKKTDVSRLTILLWTALVSITTAAIMLALNLVAAKGG